MESKEWYFFKYAYPCMYILHMNKVITKEELQNLDKLYSLGQAPSKEELERINSAAFRRILKYSDGKNVWDWETLKGYWEGKGHNKAIEDKDGNYEYFPDEFCTRCKIREGRVEKRELTSQGYKLTVNIDGSLENFIEGKFVNANIGDIVVTHLAYAVQKV